MKRTALQALQASGMFALARTLSAQLARILMYHNFSAHQVPGSDDVSVSALRKQFTLLRKHFQVVPLANLADQLISGKPFQGKSVALTIDDGRRNFYDVLFPLLKEFDLPATLYVVSSFIQGEDWLWTDKVLWLSRQPSPASELNAENINGFFASLNRLRPEARNARIVRLAARMNLCFPTEPPPDYAPCSWNELREMAASGLVEIGSHTVSHPILSSITEEESKLELTASRLKIEKEIGSKVVSFCFPNGKQPDYRPSQVRQVAEAGYTNAVVTASALVDKRTDILQMPRIGVSGRTNMLSFSKYIDGIEYYQAKLRRL